MAEINERKLLREVLAEKCENLNLEWNNEVVRQIIMECALMTPSDASFVASKAYSVDKDLYMDVVDKFVLREEESNLMEMIGKGKDTTLAARILAKWGVCSDEYVRRVLSMAMSYEFPLEKGGALVRLLSHIEGIDNIVQLIKDLY